jgi:hypothetical protein
MYIALDSVFSSLTHQPVLYLDLTPMTLLCGEVKVIKNQHGSKEK